MNNNYGQQEVRVRFPSEMKVNSPKTDQHLDGIKKSFTTLFDLLQRNADEIQRQIGPVQKLPELFKNLELSIQNQFETSFLQQFEAAIMSHQAQILADESRIQALQGFLERKQKQLEEKLEQVRQRYKKLLGQVAANNEERRRKLDSHAYALVNEIYPNEIQEKFSNISLPVYHYLAAHAGECAQARSAGLLEGHKAARRFVRDFLEKHEAFEKQMGKLQHKSLSPGRYKVCFWAAEVENKKTGEKKIEIRGNSSLTDLPEDIRQKVIRKIKDKIDSSDDTPLSTADREMLAELLKSEKEVCDAELQRFENDNITTFKG